MIFFLYTQDIKNGDDVNLRRLRYFVAAAEESNFRRAAEKLQMAQPPLSGQIKQLEREMGVRLFDRVGRGVCLTDAGEFLLEEARRLLAQARKTAEMTRKVGNGRVGHLRIGFLPSVGHGILPHMLREFGRAYPEVNLTLREMNPDQQTQGLKERRIDVGFIYLPVEDGSLTTRPVVCEEFIVALPENHPLADERRIPLEALKKEPFILPQQYRVPGCYSQIMKACHSAGFAPKAVQSDVWLMQTAVDLVAAGIGIAIVADSLRNLRRSGVVYRELTDPTLSAKIGSVWSEDEAYCPVLLSFLEIVSSVGQEAVSLYPDFSSPGIEVST